MIGLSPLCSTSLGKMSSATLLLRSFSNRFVTRSRIAGSLIEATRSSIWIEWYQSSSVCIWLNSAIDSRYVRTQVSTASLATSSPSAVVAAGDGEAGGEPLHVPLPGPGQRFVQIVDGEDDPPLRGGEAAEVAEVCVPAALHIDASDWVLSRSAAMVSAAPR